MVCSDTSAVQSVVRMKLDEDKLVPVDSHKLFALSGEAGDRVNFSEYIIANVRLCALRNAAQLSTKAVANYTRSELATALRKVGAAMGAVVGAVGWWDRVFRMCSRAGAGNKQRRSNEAAGGCWRIAGTALPLPPTLTPPPPCLPALCPAAVPVPHQPADGWVRRGGGPLPLLVRLPGHPAPHEHLRHGIR